jgi:cell division protein FtsW
MAQYGEGGVKTPDTDGFSSPAITKADKPKGKNKSKIGSMDSPFLMLTMIILGVGLIMVFSASFARAYFETGNPTKYFVKQAVFSVVGIAAMFIISRINLRFISRFSYLLMGISLFFLAIVPFIGVSQGDATRWIDLKVTTFQPSELAKLSVVLCFASLACKYKDKIKTFRYGVLPFACILAVIVALLMLEPHISASIIILLLGAAIMFLAGTDIKWYIILIIVAVIAGALVLSKFGYAIDRIRIWRDPFSDPLGKGFQVIQSLYAIGSGGLLGVGLGQSRQKYLYLPEEHNDYIFAIVCEELGYIGAILILILFALLIIRGFWIAMHAKDRYSTLVAGGLTTLLFLQVFFNVAVVTNLIPSTGISLPFFSYGGTALLLQLLQMGIVLGISREIPIKRAG